MEDCLLRHIPEDSDIRSHLVHVFYNLLVVSEARLFSCCQHFECNCILRNVFSMGSNFNSFRWLEWM